MHEASLHDENCFVTLTYSDANLPEFGSLDRRAWPLFMKRLRKEFGDQRIRYYHCGEYGDRYSRPHYHGCLFGCDFRDKVHVATRDGVEAYASRTLDRLWPFGVTEVGAFSFQAAAYVARYVMKKRIGDESSDQAARYSVVDRDTGEVVARREEEYSTMSRRPGIGREWYERYKDDVYPRDGVVVEGKLVRPPRYYDGLYELEGPMAAIKARRKREIDEDEQRGHRALQRQTVMEAREKLFSRELR